MSDICFIMTCMGRLSHLQQTLPTVVVQPRSLIVVVDCSCPQQSGDWVEQTYPHQVHVVRVPNQNQYRPALSRNSGAKVADTPWYCFLDADVGLQPSFVEQILPILKPGYFYRANPLTRELAGTVLCRKADFDIIQGYDEVIQNWGGDDVDFFNRLRLLGLTQASFPASWLQPISHEDALRVQHFPNKDIRYSCTLNGLYAQAKLDLMKILGRVLSGTERQNLYQSITLWMEKTTQTKSPTNFDLDIRQESLPVGGSVQCTITYKLNLK